MNETITAVIVTYGDRWQYLSILLENLCSNPVIADVVVVDNHSKNDLARLCSERDHGKLHVFRMPCNTGSAGGFAAGIKTARGFNSNYVMLFDDDTLPAEGVVSAMLERLIAYNRTAGTLANAVIPNRSSQHEFLRAKLTQKKHWLIEESVIGFNIFNVLARHLTKRGQIDLAVFQAQTLDYGLAAYGGLLFHKRLCDIIGYPDADYILYYDDIEYTNRILAHQGNVRLCPDLFMHDILDNYSSNMMARPFLGFLLADSDTKVYYQLRNQIHFEFKHVSRRRALFLVNAIVFSLSTVVVAVSLLRFSRLKVVLTAVLHGLVGKRGISAPYPLS